jgi:hypothetical protein
MVRMIVHSVRQMNNLPRQIWMELQHPTTCTAKAAVHLHNPLASAWARLRPRLPQAMVNSSSSIGAIAILLSAEREQTLRLHSSNCPHEPSAAKHADMASS